MKCALVLALLAACGSSKPAGTQGPTPADPNAPLPVACKVSEDCALVQACCGCEAGGRQVAIRADAVAGFEASRAQRCGGQMCPQMHSGDVTCDAEATCGNNGRCNVTPHLQSQ